MIENEKVALDILRVRQNVFLVVLKVKFSVTCNVVFTVNFLSVKCFAKQQVLANEDFNVNSIYHKLLILDHICRHYLKV